MTRHLAANGLNFLIVGLVIVAALLAWGINAYRAGSDTSEATRLEVPRNARLTDVAKLLQDEGVITNATVFRLGMRYEKLESKLKFGVYTVPAGASMQEIAALLSTGSSGARFRVTYRLGLSAVSLRVLDQLRAEGERDVTGDTPEAVVEAAIADKSSIDFRVTVVEGLSSWQISEGLKAIPILSGSISDVPGEGLLAPDTYAVTSGFSRQALIERMKTAQARILAEAWAARAPDLPLNSPEEALVLASIVEKETGVPTERPQVASVFINRLRRGMRLQTDPTVIYGITKGREVLGRGLRRSELRQRTAWNTYVINGLPPTPIANPGRAAIVATLLPDTTPYYFFVADGTGGHAFAVTEAEHRENVKVWREIERARRDN